MKKLVLCCLTLLMLLTACTSYIYGVPQETWDRMSQQERVEARREFERQEAARQRAAEEQARREAILRERERVRKAEEERLRRERIEAIHRGEGAYGELIRVRLQGGRMKIGDRHHRYQPITFTLADGESREIGIADRKGRETDLVATYAGGSLVLDGIRFPYERSWGGGTLYTDTGTSGPLQLKGVDVFVEIIAQHARHDRDTPRIFIIREEEPPVVIVERERKPPVVIVPEKPGRPHLPPVQPKVEKEEKRGEHHHPPHAKEREPVNVPPRAVEVAFLSGEMKVRGRNFPIEPFALRLAAGESNEVTLTAGKESRTVVVSYREGEVVIDGSRGKGSRDVSLKFDRDWRKGKAYRFGIKGKTALEKVEVRVTAR